MKRVLIITYYWPPSGGGGVQRWLKFSKYLPDNNWKPIIYTPENPEIPATDNSLVSEIHSDLEVLKQPIWEPYSWYKKFTFQKKDAKMGASFTSKNKEISTLEKISRWIRGNMFIPDARKFWIRPSIKFLTAYLNDHPVDAIISTGPPHSLHLIAQGIKKNFPEIKWVADFRDPWTNIDYIDELRLTDSSMKRLKKMEATVLNEADAICSAWYFLKDQFSAQIDSEKIKVILNGFDEFDLKTHEIEPDTKFTISHVGSFTPNRNVPQFWEALAELVEESEEFAQDLQIKVIGQIDGSIMKTIADLNLGRFVQNQGYVAHEKVLQFLMQSRLLLLVINNTPVAKGHIPGKLFEYLFSQRPILTLGPEECDVNNILARVQGESVVEYENKREIKTRLQKHYLQFKKGESSSAYQNLNQFSRSYLTKKLADLLNEITG